MSDERKISCHTTCLDSSVIQNIQTTDNDNEVSLIPFRCKISNEQEVLTLISDELAHTIVVEHILTNSLDAKLACAILDTKLCECDLVTLVQQPESMVLKRLDQMESQGLITRYLIHDMNYYGVSNDELYSQLKQQLSK